MKARKESRKRHGLCIANLSCATPPVRRWLCQHHLDAARATKRKSNAKAYLAKKIAGLCVVTGCRGKALDHTVLCLKCDALRRGTKRRPRAAAATRKRWWMARVKAGLCGQCGAEPLESRRYGESCLQKFRVRARLSYLRRHPNAKQTREQMAVRGLRLEDFMFGDGNLAEAQR